MIKLRSRRLQFSALLCLVFIGILFWITIASDNYQLIVSQYDVPLKGLPAELDGYKVVQITDIHWPGGLKESYLNKVICVCNQQHPDLIVLTGDFTSRRKDIPGIPILAHKLAELRASDGVCAVLGNHDYWNNAALTRHAFEKEKIPVLINCSIPVKKGLYLVGIDDIWAGHPDAAAAFKNVPPQSAAIVISHNPRVYSLIQDRDCLALTGHSHGGQILIPHMPVILPQDLRWTHHYIYGWVHTNKARMYINRGIGTGRPHIRFRCPPEVAVFHLRSESQNQLTSKN